MKYGLMLCLTVVLCIAAGCSKKSDDPGTGTIYFINTTSDPYAIFVDGTSKGILQARQDTSFYNIQVGTHILKTVQQSGFTTSPSIFEVPVELHKGGQAGLTL